MRMTAEDWRKRVGPIAQRELAAMETPGLPSRVERLEIFLPDFLLTSINSIPSSRANFGWQSGEKRRAKAALQIARRAGVRLWFIPGKVHITFIQMVKDFGHARDCSNYCVKYLLDCLTRRGGGEDGLALIEDDRPAFVENVTVGVRKCSGNWRPGVFIIIDPIKPNPLAPREPKS